MLRVYGRDGDDADASYRRMRARILEIRESNAQDPDLLGEIQTAIEECVATEEALESATVALATVVLAENRALFFDAHQKYRAVLHENEAHEFEAHDQRISTLNTTITEKDAAIAGLEAKVTAADQRTADNGRTITEKNLAIATIRAELDRAGDMGVRIGNANAEIKQKTTIISNLESAARKHNDYYRALHANWGNRYNLLEEELKAAQKAASKEITELKTALDQAHGETTDTSGLLEKATTNISNLTNAPDLKIQGVRTLT